MFKRTISAMIIAVFIFTIGPVPIVLALRPTSEGSAVGKLGKEISAAAAGGGVDTAAKRGNMTIDEAMDVLKALIDNPGDITKINFFPAHAGRIPVKELKTSQYSKDDYAVIRKFLSAIAGLDEHGLTNNYLVLSQKDGGLSVSKGKAPVITIAAAAGAVENKLTKAEIVELAVGLAQAYPRETLRIKFPGTFNYSWVTNPAVAEYLFSRGILDSSDDYMDQTQESSRGTMGIGELPLILTNPNAIRIIKRAQRLARKNLGRMFDEGRPPTGFSFTRDSYTEPAEIAVILWDQLGSAKIYKNGQLIANALPGTAGPLDDVFLEYILVKRAIKNAFVRGRIDAVNVKGNSIDIITAPASATGEANEVSEVPSGQPSVGAARGAAAAEVKKELYDTAVEVANTVSEYYRTAQLHVVHYVVRIVGQGYYDMRLRFYASQKGRTVTKIVKAKDIGKQSPKSVAESAQEVADFSTDGKSVLLRIQMSEKKGTSLMTINVLPVTWSRDIAGIAAKQRVMLVGATAVTVELMEFLKAEMGFSEVDTKESANGQEIEELSKTYDLIIVYLPTEYGNYMLAGAINSHLTAATVQDLKPQLKAAIEVWLSA